MQTSAQGRQLIEDFEGLFLHAYYDSVHVLTIGYGHTNIGGTPPHVSPGMTMTKDQADDALENDLRATEELVDKIMDGITLEQCQFDALVSFEFNTGDLFKSSIPRLIKSGQTDGAMSCLLLYNHAGGRVLSGLTRRRKAERLMFLGEVDAALNLAAQ